MYRSRRTLELTRLYPVCAAAALATVLIVTLSLPARAQEPYQYESDLVAKRRLYRDVGAGFREILSRYFPAATIASLGHLAP